MLPVKILRNSRTFHFFRRVWVQTISANYDNFGWENFDNLCTCSNLEITNLESFGWPLYSGPFFNFCKGFVTSLKNVQSSTIKRVVQKIIIMAFNEIKHFVGFFQLWKKPNIKSQNIVSLVLHLKNEIDLEKMLND